MLAAISAILKAIFFDFKFVKLSNRVGIFYFDYNIFL